MLIISRFSRQKKEKKQQINAQEYLQQLTTATQLQCSNYLASPELSIGKSCCHEDLMSSVHVLSLEAREASKTVGIRSIGLSNNHHAGSSVHFKVFHPLSESSGTGVVVTGRRRLRVRRRLRMRRRRLRMRRQRGVTEMREDRGRRIGRYQVGDGGRRRWKWRY